MISRQEKINELTTEIFPHFSPEKTTILQSALPSLYALLENPKFHEDQEEELKGIRCGFVFETLAKEEFGYLRSPLMPLRRLEESIISSMRSDIGILRLRGESFHRPDILVMEYDKSSRIVTITQIGEIKLGLWKVSATRLGEILKQRNRFVDDLREYLGEVAYLRNGSDLESLFGLPIDNIKLLTEEEGLQLFYVLPHKARVPHAMKKWKIYHSDFSQQEIEEITQALLRTTPSKA